MADEPGQFRLEGDTPNGFRWTLTTDTGQLIATSGEFPDRAAAEKSIQWVKINVSGCPVLDPPYTGPYVG
jgi:uncharacterized protein YegP (UPF0339 family)